MSRNIDEQIIDKVMGLGPDEWRDAYPSFERKYRTEEGETVWHLFSPSTDATAAMQVVERMREKAAGIDIFIRHAEDPRGRPAFCCYMHSFIESAWKEGRLDEDASAEADTLPMAVCLAALSALGVETKGEEHGT